MAAALPELRRGLGPLVFPTPELRLRGAGLRAAMRADCEPVAEALYRPQAARGGGKPVQPQRAGAAPQPRSDCGRHCACGVLGESPATALEALNDTFAGDGMRQSGARLQRWKRVRAARRRRAQLRNDRRTLRVCRRDDRQRRRANHRMDCALGDGSIPSQSPDPPRCACAGASSDARHPGPDRCGSTPVSRSWSRPRTGTTMPHAMPPSPLLLGNSSRSSVPAISPIRSASRCNSRCSMTRGRSPAMRGPPRSTTRASWHGR